MLRGGARGVGLDLEGLRIVLPLGKAGDQPVSALAGLFEARTRLYQLDLDARTRVAQVRKLLLEAGDFGIRFVQFALRQPGGVVGELLFIARGG